jgi:hypothetical protein
MASVFCAILAAACSDNDLPAEPRVDYMTASVNGSAWEASLILSATYQNLVLTISGENNTQQIVRIASADVSGTGDFLLSPGNATAALGNVIQGTAIWASNIQSGSGTLTITALTQTRVAGTFNFIAFPATQSATGFTTVTAGSFDITF